MGGVNTAHVCDVNEKMSPLVTSLFTNVSKDVCLLQTGSSFCKQWPHWESNRRLGRGYREIDS